jgi:glycerol-3-phosphate acyltransferase PlsY
MAAIPAVLTGYLLGSIPTAFLLVRWRRRFDIRKAGSGNVGALNTYAVTGSRGMGAAVLVIDLLKGVAATALGAQIHPAGAGAAGTAAVLGHCYCVWLGFKGGRGLATAAGVVLMLGWPFVAIWGVFWLGTFAAARRVNVGNLIATILTGAAVLVAPGIFEEFSLLGSTHAEHAAGWILGALIIIITRVAPPVAEALRLRKNAGNARADNKEL